MFGMAGTFVVQPNIQALASDQGPSQPLAMTAQGHVWTAPAVQEESDYQRSVRVQSCIRPLKAAVLTAGPDVIR